jgi:rhodanese-related sulfurtransferase
MNRTAIRSLAFVLFVSAGAAAQAADAAETRVVPREKQTKLGLYLTAREAFEKWKAEPEKVKILDVRTPDEFVFVGHPSMAWHVPFAYQSYQWDPSGRRLPMKPNPDFVSQVKGLADPSDTLFVICRSGTRSAKAVDALADAGFRKVYNIIEGFEGDVVVDPGSELHGKRMADGWKNAGLPWDYALDPARMRLPATPCPSEASAH